MRGLDQRPPHAPRRTCLCLRRYAAGGCGPITQVDLVPPRLQAQLARIRATASQQHVGDVYPGAPGALMKIGRIVEVSEGRIWDDDSMGRTRLQTPAGRNRRQTLLVVPALDSVHRGRGREPFGADVAPARAAHDPDILPTALLVPVPPGHLWVSRQVGTWGRTVDFELGAVGRRVHKVSETGVFVSSFRHHSRTPVF